MTPEQWATIAELFAAACEQPPAARHTWLLEACADAAIRAEVLAMLAAYNRDPAYLERAADPRDVLDRADRDVLAGRRLGAYRLTREIGRGGMGVVYEAVRDDQEFDRRAAVKILPAWSAAVLADRFRFERRVLAGLDHPGIARLLDAGTDDEGVPYCVMEFVDGLPIDEWCDARHLDLAGRVRLFERVCEAVAHAHGHLVVHRDLKPSNILVTADGQPKLLDFGIATLLDAEDGMSAGMTRTGFTSFTPEFASPEQMRGERVTTASDTYSLGVLLFRLLTGRQPYELRGLPPAEALRVACDVEPPRPSTVAPADVRPRLAGDLDTVVSTALRKDRTQRYATVDALAADLRAWREHRPIAAAPPSWAYVARRFVRRHRVGVASAAALAAAVAAGTAATAWQAREAERERARADARFSDTRQLANAVVGPLYDAIARVPGSTEARQVLVKEALTYLDRLSGLAGDDVALMQELADAYEKIGDVQGNPFGPNLGDRAAAAASYARLASLRAAVLAARPADPDATRLMAEADQRLGDAAFGESRLDDAISAYERGAARLAGAALESATPAVLTLTRLYGRIGTTQARKARYGEAAAAFERAIAMVRPLAEQQDASPEARRLLMATLGNSGDVPFYQGRYEDALARYDAARAIARQAMTSATDRAAALRDLQLTTTRSAYALKQLGRLDEGMALETEAVRLLSDQVLLDPRAVSRRFELGQAKRGLALTELQRQRPEAARREAADAVAVFEAAFALDPSPEDRFMFAATLGTLAEAEWAMKQSREAAGTLRRALAVLDEPGIDLRQPSERPRLQWLLGDALVALAREGGGAAYRQEARALYVRARDEFAALQKAGTLPPKYRDAAAQIQSAIDALERR